MRTGLWKRIAVLSILSMLFSGCVESYRVFPSVAVRDQVVSADSAKIYVNYHYDIKPNVSWLYLWVDNAKATRKALLGVLHKARWDVVETEAPASDSLACEVSVRTRPFSGGIGAAGISLFLLPDYEEGAFFSITYALSMNGVPLKKFEYDIVSETWMWLPLVFVSWMTFATPSLDDAVAEATRQFLHDADPLIRAGLTHKRT